jgi:NRPS condensation-like uncharacterized protein
MSSSGKNNIIFKDVEYDPFADVVLQYPTTAPQREIWTNVQIGGHAANCAYNESVTLTLKGAFSVDRFRKSVSLLFERHDALRSTFSTDGLTVTVSDQVNPDVPLIDLSDKSEDQKNQSVSLYLESEVEFDFDLENGPLGKVTVIRKSTDLHLIVLTFHHIVCDGWSLGIMMQDLGSIYSSLVETGTYNDDPAMSYRDYASKRSRISKAKKTFRQKISGLASTGIIFRQWTCRWISPDLLSEPIMQTCRYPR